LGFLDVDAETQKLVLQFMREHPFRASLEVQLRQYPATTAYGLAVAAAIGLSEEEVGSGAVYGAFEAAFGYNPPPPTRRDLAESFLRQIERLGLTKETIFDGQELHIRGGCYLFQGGILPHFVDPLRTALERVQKKVPLPDPDDSERAAEYAKLLAEKVHPAQSRLRQTLHSSVGAFLVRRLVRWHLTGDDTLFPAHIRPLLAEEKARGVFSRSPYVLFDVIRGQLQLFLPAQKSSVADTNTRWSVPQLRPMGALHERPAIPLCELCLESGQFEVQLQKLSGELEDIKYQLYAGIPDTYGFRVFDAESGRERKFTPDSQGNVDFPQGSKLIVLFDGSNELESNHESASVGEWYYVEFEATPTASPLVLRTAGEERCLFRPLLRSGIYFQREHAAAFRATRMASSATVQVFYGSNVGLTCAVPETVNSPAKVRFSTSWDPSLGGEAICREQTANNGLALCDLTSVFTQWLSSLPWGVHSVSVELDYEGRSKVEEITYWRGLDRVSTFGDFECETIPGNLQHFQGFKKEGAKLIRSRALGGRSELGFSKLGLLELEKWEVPGNHLRVVLIEQDESQTPLEEGSSIDILREDSRVIQFHFGGLLPIAIYCGQKVLGELSSNRPVISFHLLALEAEFGRSGILRAEASSQSFTSSAWEILKWRTPQTALECRSEEVHAGNVAWLVRKVSLQGMSALRLRIVNLESRLKRQDAELTTTLTVPKEGETPWEIDLAQGLICSVHRLRGNVAQVRFELIRLQQAGTIRVIDLECLVNEAEDWQPVLCVEPHSRLAIARLIFTGTKNQEAASSIFTELFWGDPQIAVRPELVPADHLNHYFETAKWLIQCRYPANVWSANRRRLESLYTRLSSYALFGSKTDRAAWWRHSIDEYQRHASESQPIVMPRLLFCSNLKMAANRLTDCGPSDFGEKGIVARVFSEASLYENRSGPGTLSYVINTLNRNGLDLNFVTHFSNFQQLGQQRNVPFGRLHLRDWFEQLRSGCATETPCTEEAQFPLLSAQHFIAASEKLKRRAGVLRSVSLNSHGHWLESFIAGIRTSRHKILPVVKSVYGRELGDIPAEIFLRPLEESGLMSGITFEERELVLDLTVSCVLLALTLRARALALISYPQVESMLTALLGQASIELSPEDRLQRLYSHISLILGTAPETFSFYYLLFTLTLTPPNEPRN
jgi:hypothetical protein